MRMWVIRFQYIPFSDYLAPMCYIPTEQTGIEAESADDAWEKWVTDPLAGPRENYKRIEIYEQ